MNKELLINLLSFLLGVGAMYFVAWRFNVFEVKTISCEIVNKTGKDVTIHSVSMWCPVEIDGVFEVTE